MAHPAAFCTAAAWPGLARVFLPPRERRARSRQSSTLSHRHVLSGLMGGLAGIVVVLIVVSLLSQPSKPAGCTGLTCEIRPASGPPVENGGLYTNTKFGFTARILTQGLPVTTSTANDELSITFNGTGGLQGEFQLGAEASGGQTAEQIVNTVINKIANGAELAYQFRDR